MRKAESKKQNEFEPKDSSANFDYKLFTKIKRIAAISLAVFICGAILMTIGGYFGYVNDFTYVLGDSFIENALNYDIDIGQNVGFEISALTSGIKTNVNKQLSCANFEAQIYDSSGNCVCSTYDRFFSVHDCMPINRGLWSCYTGKSISDAPSNSETVKVLKEANVAHYTDKSNLNDKAILELRINITRQGLGELEKKIMDAYKHKQKITLTCGLINRKCAIIRVSFVNNKETFDIMDYTGNTFDLTLDASSADFLNSTGAKTDVFGNKMKTAEKTSSSNAFLRMLDKIGEIMKEPFPSLKEDGSADVLAKAVFQQYEEKGRINRNKLQDEYKSLIESSWLRNRNFVVNQIYLEPIDVKLEDTQTSKSYFSMGMINDNIKPDYYVCTGFRAMEKANFSDYLNPKNIYVLVSTYNEYPLANAVSEVTRYSDFSYGNLFIIVVSVAIILILYYLSKFKGVQTEMAEFKSELSNQQCELAVKQRALSEKHRELLLAVAHEMKTPFGVVQLYGERLVSAVDEIKGKSSRKELDKSVNIIGDAACDIVGEIDKMNSLLQDILDAARLESGSITMKKKMLSVAQAVRDVAEGYEPLANDKDVEISIISSGECFTIADPYRIKQAISNYLSNAVKFSPNSGKIKVTVSEIGNKIVISIFNQGAHISDEMLEKMWEPFVKDENGDNALRGTGLGLSIVKSIATLHGGDCKAENTDDGVCFRLIIPKVSN